MTYRTASGRIFTLAYHSLSEWAALEYERVKLLGCSEQYALAVRLQIGMAAPLDQGVGHVR